MVAVAIVALSVLVAALTVVALIVWLDGRAGSLTELRLELHLGPWFQLRARIRRHDGRVGLEGGPSAREDKPARKAKGTRGARNSR